MAWQRIHNRTGVPVNVKLTNAGITYHFENNVYKYTEFFTAGVGWDLTVAYSSHENGFNDNSDNIAPISAIVSLTTGIALTVGGVVLTVFTAGAATPVVIAGVEVIGAAAAATAGTVSTVAGAVSTVASIGVEVASRLLYPATVTGFFGANDHNIYIDGGFVGTVDTNNALQVTDVKPLAISYINCQSGEKTEAPGYKIE